MLKLLVSHNFKRYNLSANYHVSKISNKLITELVPALGESITEGSISNWLKNVGDPVGVDEVVVVIETDKVTVDIKSQNAGILTKKIAVDTVIVGNPLFEIETEGGVQPIPTKENLSTSQKAVKINVEELHHKHRTPLIKFVGKRSHEKFLLLKQDSSPQKPIEIKETKIKSSKNSVSFLTLKDKAWYGRPRLSQKEIDAVESGGATVF
eukprot:gene5545-7664_t